MRSAIIWITAANQTDTSSTGAGTVFNFIATATVDSNCGRMLCFTARNCSEMMKLACCYLIQIWLSSAIMHFSDDYVDEVEMTGTRCWHDDGYDVITSSALLHLAGCRVIKWCENYRSRPLCRFTASRNPRYFTHHLGLDEFCRRLLSIK